MDSQSFLPIIQGFLGGAISAGVFKGPIKSLEDWWYVSYGHDLSEQASMLRQRQEVNVEAYKTEILKEVAKIDPNHVKEPELKILGPSLEASKYYVEDEPLRIMFAKLIASSMDESKENTIHSSYVEIIKQMAPLDAENLLCIHKNGDADMIARIKIPNSNGGHVIRHTNLYLGNPNEKKQKLISPSLDNLTRLGSIDIDYNTFYRDKTKYEVFKNTEEYFDAEKFVSMKNEELNQLKERAENLRKEMFKQKNIIPPTPISEFANMPTLSTPEIVNGYISITPYGKNFCATCL